MTDADRALVLRPEARAWRAQIAAMIKVGGSQLDQLPAVAPSYIVSAVNELRRAMTQWETDERDALAHRNPPPSERHYA